MNLKQISTKMFISSFSCFVIGLLFILIEKWDNNPNHTVSTAMLTCSLVMFYMGLSVRPTEE